MSNLDHCLYLSINYGFKNGGGWMIFHYSSFLVHFVFCSLNFIVLYSIFFYKILPYYVYQYCILIR